MNHYTLYRMEMITLGMTGLGYLRVKYLLYISVSIDDVVQNTTALILSFCFSRKRRTVPKQKQKKNQMEDKILNKSFNQIHQITGRAPLVAYQ